MTRKHTKHSQEWLDIAKGLVPKKNTTEKDKNDKIIDKPEIELLAEKRIELESQITTLETEIQTGNQSSKKAVEISKLYRSLERRKTDMTNNPANYHSDDLHLGGATQFNYDAKIKNHYGKDATNHGKDNLYLLTVDGNNEDITEEQIINVIARVCHGLGEMKEVADFKAKFASWDATNAGAMNTLLDRLILDGKQVKQGQTFYDFTHTYTQQNLQDNTKHNIPYPNDRVITDIIADFYTWLNLVSGKKTVGGVEKTLAETLEKDNTHTESVPIYLKGDPWKNSDLKDWFGITLNTGQTFYKSSGNARNFTVKGGVGGWIELGNTVNQTGNGNRTKLTYNFTANAPTTNSTPQELFESLRTNIASWNENTKTWDWDGTNPAGLENTTNLDGVNDILEELGVQRKLEIQEVSLTKREINKKISEKATKTTEKTALETKIDKLITDRLAELRTELTTTYKIADGFEDNSSETDGKDNRRTLADIKKIKELIEDIRFLEKNDDSVDSSVNDENTAYTKVKELFDKWGNSRACWFDLEEGATNADKAKKIKDKNVADLQSTHDSFETWEKKVKFDDKQKQQLADIKIVLGKNKDPLENLEVYQTKLKELDPILTDAIITKEMVDDWQTQNNFKTAETMSAELSKVLKDKALDDTFKAVMTKADSELTDIGKLLQKKKAKEIITMIRRWEYDNGLGIWKDIKKDERRKRLVWTFEVKDPNDDKKYLEDKELKDSEIDDYLYKIAVESKTLASVKKADETNGDDNQNQPEKDGISKHFSDNWYWYLGGVVLIIGLLGVVFWKNISEWWNGPDEKESSGSNSKTEDDDESED